jgi:hypothetical protein
MAKYCTNEQYNEPLSGGGSGDQQRDRDPDRDHFDHQIPSAPVSGFGVLDEFADERHVGKLSLRHDDGHCRVFMTGDMVRYLLRIR